MSKIPDQIHKLIEDHGPCKTLPDAQVNALLAGKGRVEHLQTFAEEFDVELRLERKPKRK